MSFNNRAQFNDTLKESRAKVAAQIGAAADEIALTRNTSEGNSIITNGLNFRAGRRNRHLGSEPRHQQRGLGYSGQAVRLKIVRVSVPKVPESDEQVVELFRKACSDRTKVLTFTEVSNVNGLKCTHRGHDSTHRPQ